VWVNGTGMVLLRIEIAPHWTLSDDSSMLWSCHSCVAVIVLFSVDRDLSTAPDNGVGYRDGRHRVYV
jgi:hypothetical protein